ncbi:MAG: YegJ family protein [Thermoguttaceae bacterium]
MGPRLFIVACLAIVMITGCTSKPDTRVEDGYDEAEMAAATQRAIGEVDSFISDLNAGRSENYAVKAPITENGETEHFWLTDVTFDGTKFTGTINNEPGMVTNVKMGQKWTLGKTEISDWMYMRDGKMYGNYTLRPLLPTMPPKVADQFRAILATP